MSDFEYELQISFVFCLLSLCAKIRRVAANVSFPTFVLEIDLRLSVLERFSKQPHFKHWFAAESTFTTIETEISPTATASLANPFSASKDEADLWKKLYQVIGQIRLCALKGTGRKRGPEYAMSLFMSATEEMATQQDPRRQIVLMALSLAFAKDLRPAAHALPW